MLSNTLGGIKDAIDAEKAAVSDRVKSLAWDTKEKIKKLNAHGYGYRGAPAYGGYGGYGGYGAPQHGGYGGYGGGYGGPYGGFGGYGSNVQILYAQTEAEAQAQELEAPHDHSHGSSGYGYHDAIHEVIDAFDAALEAEAAAFDGFVNGQRQILEDQIGEKKAAFAEAKEGERHAYNTAAEDAQNDFHYMKIEKIAHLDSIIAKKLEWADANIKQLKYHFKDEFLKTLTELSSEVD